MKIAFVSYECPPEAGGGIGTYIWEASRMLAARGHRVEVFAGSPNRSSTSELPDGVIVHRVEVADRRTFPVKIAPIVVERHLAAQFDVLEGPEYMAEAAEARRLLPDLPYVVKLHTSMYFIRQIEYAAMGLRERITHRWKSFRRGVPPDWSAQHPTAVAEIKSAHDADRVAAPTKSIGEYVIRDWNIPFTAVDFFPYPYRPPQSYLQLPIGVDSQVVTFVGRLEFRKGVINLAKAVPLVRRVCPNVKFQFVGGTLASPVSGVSMLDYLRKLLGEHLVAVEFLGRQPPEALPNILSTSAVLAFPSIWENSAYVCLEAMAAGRAVIGSQNCGLEELLDGGRVGRVIDPHSPEDIAAKIIELLQNASERRRLGELARERVLTTYAPDVVGPQQEACYERAIQMPRKTPI